MQPRTSILVSIIVAVGIALAGLFVAQGLLGMKQSERIVAVKGLSEREVTSDLALWNLGYTVTGSDLATTQKELQSQAGVLANYLTNAGLKADEISQDALKITDRQANQYNNNGENGPRYILSTQLKIRSTNIDAVQAAARSIGDVVRDSGVVLGAPDQYGCDLRLVFTGLDGIKPAMIAEATKDARRAAEQFAQDSGVEVGAIKTATQGYFSISARDGSEAEGGGGAACEAETSVVKKVRVVTNVTYFLG